MATVPTPQSPLQFHYTKRYYYQCTTYMMINIKFNGYENIQPCFIGTLEITNHISMHVALNFSTNIIVYTTDNILVKL